MESEMGIREYSSGDGDRRIGHLYVKKIGECGIEDGGKRIQQWGWRSENMASACDGDQKPQHRGWRLENMALGKEIREYSMCL